MEAKAEDLDKLQLNQVRQTAQQELAEQLLVIEAVQI
jgi:hypothetical protein